MAKSVYTEHDKPPPSTLDRTGETHPAEYMKKVQNAARSPAPGMERAADKSFNRGMDKQNALIRRSRGK